MASTTKIMTGILVVEHVNDYRAVVRAPANVTEPGEDSIWLQPGERLTVDQLMKALLIKSANDAALTLGDYVAGNARAFVAMMNAKALELGLAHTHYRNPHGLDQPGHYTSALDLARLARYAMREPRFRSYVHIYRTTIPWRKHPWPRLLISHNQLLHDYPWVDGVKTGMTDDAGYCIAASGRYGGRRFIVTLLHEPTPKRRVKDAVALFKYAARLYDKRRVVAAGAVLGHAQVPYHDEGVDLVVQKPATALMRTAAQVISTVRAPTRIPLPVTQGQVLGAVVYKADGVVVARRWLVAERGFPKADWQTRAGYGVHQAWSWVKDEVGRVLSWF
jgi:D-alanyl-D-alanine carboxypeptidase (penicillin-binding protein 5/6)